MMQTTVADVIAALDAIDIPNALFKWPKNMAPPLPYALLVPIESYGQATGDGMSYEAWHYSIELYSRDYDVPLTKSVTQALRSVGKTHLESVYVDETNQFCICHFPMTLIEQEAT